MHACVMLYPVKHYTPTTGWYYIGWLWQTQCFLVNNDAFSFFSKNTNSTFINIHISGSLKLILLNIPFSTIRTLHSFLRTYQSLRFTKYVVINTTKCNKPNVSTATKTPVKTWKNGTRSRLKVISHIETFAKRLSLSYSGPFVFYPKDV